MSDIRPGDLFRLADDQRTLYVPDVGLYSDRAPLGSVFMALGVDDGSNVRGVYRRVHVSHAGIGFRFVMAYQCIRL